LSPSSFATGSSPFSIWVPYGQWDITNASTIGLSDLGTFALVVGCWSLVTESVALAVSGISCGIKFSPSLVTWTGTSCPSIESVTS